ncbi:histidine kinase dimerization/phospho-acceptor domain-containing protein [Dactylosporangium sp. CA-152071]|uniref:sensor histidine kinase n=1 Tax=Dactylosporangium sp. CA-152071 TaxID=3239933 RepID=UPI003D8EF2A0
MTVDPELLAAALDQLGTGLLVTSADGTVVAANQATRDLLGEQATGKKVGDTVAAAMAAEDSGRWSPRPGLVVEWSWSGPLLPGTPHEGRCLVLRDVSHRIADRARLRRQNRALAELVAMKAEFTAAVSHELRTPVTSIAAMSELLGEEVTEPDPLAVPVAAVARNAQRLLGLIDNVTELARIENAAPTGTGEKVQLERIVAEALSGWTGAAKAAAVHLTAHADPDATVQGDRVLLRRLVDAMIGIGLAAAEPGALLTVGVTATGSGWRVTVPIGGRGGDRLFTSSLLTGDGVRHDSTALMLCRAIIARHGGRLTTDTDPEGATVLAAHLPG